MNSIFKNNILNQGKLSWHEILDSVDHDELVYKLTLRFLRRDGYDMGNNKTPEVKSTL